MIQIGLLGATGRMGRCVLDLIESEFKTQAQIKVSVGSEADLALLLSTDAVIDFSSPAAMTQLAELALNYSAPLPAFVVGSTGWRSDSKKVLEALSGRARVLMSSNFSTGVMAMTEILRWASPRLEKLGYSPVIVETHHRHKKDSPSGTALSLQRAIAPNSSKSIQTHAIRSGEIVGDHEVTFYGFGDHIVLGHFAQDRSIFARGAIDVALWLTEQSSRSDLSGGILGMDTFFKERFQVAEALKSSI